MKFLITGTDTEVGKTFFTVNALKSLIKMGLNVCGIKPVETGCSPICHDAEEISKTCGKNINPVYSFKTPVAPSVASQIEKSSINIEHLKSEINRFCKNYEIVLIEGAGGIMVPITNNYKFLDLAKELDLKIVIIALNKLGVINHTLLTVKACQCEGVKVSAIILNNKEERVFDESRETNYKTIKELTNLPVFQFKTKEDIYDIAREVFLKT